MALWIALGIGVVVLLWAILTFNRLVRNRNRVNNAWSNIDVQLRRRYDLIPNLIETVKGYASHERQVFEEVTRARAAGQAASGVQDQAAAENQVSQSLRQLLALAESYPQLQANQNFLELQEELTATESKIAFARQFYNDQVQSLNTTIESVPSNFIAAVFRFKQREFFEIDETARGPVSVGGV